MATTVKAAPLPPFKATDMLLQIVEYCIKEEWNFVLESHDGNPAELSLDIWNGTLRLQSNGEWSWKVE